MARLELKLSDLRNNVEYPVNNNTPDGRCLIHVKLTELSMKSVQSLIHSDKGAFFSLWFEDNGGSMAIPLSSGGTRRFDFKTAPLQEAEDHSSLECVHQSMDTSRKQALSCWGPLQHRLTVQGTDDVYIQTKDRMKKAEQERQGQKAQEIKLPSNKGRSKASRFAQSSSSAKASSSKVKPVALPALKQPLAKYPSGSARSPRTLKERILHLLALKPQKRPDIVARLKKDTKRSESTMTNLDGILQEVADLQSGMYTLKDSLYSTLQVDDWPFYSEAERQLIKRSITQVKPSLPMTNNSTEHLNDLHVPPTKRPNASSKLDGAPNVKRAKLSPSPPPSSFSSSAAQAVKPPPAAAAASITLQPPPPAKKKKKKAKDKVSTERKTAPAADTKPPPDYSSEFPAIASDQQRSEYKQLFSREYEEYTQLKDSIGQVMAQYRHQCMELSQQLQCVEKNSEEEKVIKQKIREKYAQLQKEQDYQIKKKRFEELHYRLEHIKKTVIVYDTKHQK